MRTRKEIEGDQFDNHVMREIFLDIRELLMKANETEKDREIRRLNSAVSVGNGGAKNFTVDTDTNYTLTVVYN